MTSIGGNAFYGCAALTSIYIPNSVTNIQDHFNGYCNNLDTLKVDTENSVYDSRNDCNAIIETATNKLITACNNTIIPNTVQIINNFAFWGCDKLTSIVIPKSVITINDNAFYYSEGLTSVTFEMQTPQSFGKTVFAGCDSLTSIFVPLDSVEAYRTATNFTEYADKIKEI